MISKLILCLVVTTAIFTPLEAEGESLDLVAGSLMQRTARPTFKIRNRNLRAKYCPIEAVV